MIKALLRTDVPAFTNSSISIFMTFITAKFLQPIFFHARSMQALSSLTKTCSNMASAPATDPGMQWGNFKRVLKTASGLIKIVLLSYYSHNPAPDLRRFIISSSHPKWIWWVILRNRKRLWPIFRPSASASKTRKKCYNISVLFF